MSASVCVPPAGSSTVAGPSRPGALDRPGASAAARVAQLDRPLDRLARPQQPEADARGRREQAGGICGLHVDHAAARGEHARQVLVRGVVEDGPRRQHERGLDLRRRPRGVALVQQRRRAGHGRGRHARARPGAVAARDRRDDVDAGRRDVGLERQRVRRRPTRGERGDQPGVRGDLLVRLVVERERELPAGSAACTSIIPPPAASTLVGCLCAVSLKTGRAVSTSADLICAGVQVGMALAQERGRARRRRETPCSCPTRCRSRRGSARRCRRRARRRRA